MSRCRGLREVVLVLSALVWGSPGLALWPSNPALNLNIADGASEQVQPKIVPRPDGGCYISWFDNAMGGYDVRLQRLDALGNEVWAHNGVLVADRDFSSTQDYGLSIDTAGNALLAYRFEVAGVVHIFAAKVSPTGMLLWGPTGVQVSMGSTDSNSPRITGTTDGNAVVAWSQGADVVAQKLASADGMALWAAAGVHLVPASGSFLIADLQAADAGNAIVSWVPNPARHLWAQKLASADGASLWNAAHVKVYDEAGGTLQFGNFPPFLSDGAGGAVFAWYTSSPSLQVRTQRVLSTGLELFPHNGSVVSTDASQGRTSPSVVFEPVSQDTYVFWRENNSLQSQSGVAGQRFNVDGMRQWGNSGITIVPLGSQDISQVQAFRFGREPGVAWVTSEAFDDQPIYAERFNSAGTEVWSAMAMVKTANTGTSRLATAKSTAGYTIFAWTDGESARDLKAQNLNSNGSLGVAVFSDGFESGNTSAWSMAVP